MHPSAPPPCIRACNNNNNNNNNNNRNIIITLCFEREALTVAWNLCTKNKSINTVYGEGGLYLKLRSLQLSCFLFHLPTYIKGIHITQVYLGHKYKFLRNRLLITLSNCENPLVNGSGASEKAFMNPIWRHQIKSRVNGYNNYSLHPIST